jgi:3-oxoacyl-[acyl-carrier protein] reductase
LPLHRTPAKEALGMTTQRAAIVTGSARGIGRAIAKRLAADGVALIVNYRSSREDAEKAVAEIAAGGGQAVAVQADVADPDQLRSLFDAAERHYGGLDILVNNVGTARFTTIAEATDEDYDAVFTTNTRTTFVALREAANRLRDGGRIVVISGGVTAIYQPNSGIYAASKAAGDQLVRTLAREIGARGITVNSVLPGATRTDALLGHLPSRAIEQIAAQTPLRRIGEPDDIADIVAFLASDAGRWITGQALHAGGGMF